MVIFSLLAAAAWLRCRDLGNLPGINGDEAWYGVQAELLLHGQPISWHTPTGNWLNPLWFGPQLLLHRFFEPSFGLLRMPAVVSGIAALGVNFWLCRRALGRRMALISTLILAVLPIDIAYSRLAWDASQSLLVTLPAIYGPLLAIAEPRRKIFWSEVGLAGIALAIVVHPTNLFVGPIAAVCLGYVWRDELRPGWEFLRRRRKLALASAVALVIVLGWICGPRLAGCAARAGKPLQYRDFAIGVSRLFSGVTVYQYVSGALLGESQVALAATDAAAWIVFCWLALGLIARRNRKRMEAGERIVGCLAVGFAAALGAFFLIAGPDALSPEFERYAIWMVAPAAILAASGLEWWLVRPGRAGRLAFAAAAALGCGLLLGFQTNYFGFLEQTGGRSHRTFHTAAIEPKQAAFDYILAHSGSSEDVRIVASEWWNYWPLRYLSLGARATGRVRSLTVEMQDEPGATVPSLNEPLQRQWRVEFADSRAAAAIRRAAAETGDNGSPPKIISESTIDDFSGQPVISIFDFGPNQALPISPLGFPAENMRIAPSQKN